MKLFIHASLHIQPHTHSIHSHIQKDGHTHTHILYVLMEWIQLNINIYSFGNSTHFYRYLRFRSTKKRNRVWIDSQFYGSGDSDDARYSTTPYYIIHVSIYIMYVNPINSTFGKSVQSTQLYSILIEFGQLNQNKNVDTLTHTYVWYIAHSNHLVAFLYDFIC